jgi:RNase P subunit RPR2
MNTKMSSVLDMVLQIDTKEAVTKMKMAIAETHVDLARSILEHLPNEQRLKIFDSIRRGYCKHCGTKDPKYKCQCWNDE